MIDIQELQKQMKQRGDESGATEVAILSIAEQMKRIADVLDKVHYMDLDEGDYFIKTKAISND